jgi:hypothetical protein
MTGAAVACGGGNGGHDEPAADGPAGDGAGPGSDGALWIVGENTPLRWTGAAWQVETGGLPVTGSAGVTFRQVADAWVASSDEAWGVSRATNVATGKVDSAVLRWKDGTWTAQMIFPEVGLQAIWGTGSGDVWAGGNDGGGSQSFPRLFHWDGSAWTQLHAVDGELYSILAVWGRSPGEVYFGLENAIFRYDGLAVARDYNQDNFSCSGFWGTTAVNVWAACSDSFYGKTLLMRRNGPDDWSADPVATPLSLQAIHGTAANDVWAVGNVSQRAGVLHWDGTAWTPVALPDSLAVPVRGVWAASGAVWVVGDAGTVLRRDGTAWTTVPSGTTERLLKITGIQ